MTGAACGTTSQAILTRGGSIVVHPRFSASFFLLGLDDGIRNPAGSHPFATYVSPDKPPLVFAEPPVMRIVDRIN